MSTDKLSQDVSGSPKRSMSLDDLIERSRKHPALLATVFESMTDEEYERYADRLRFAEEVDQAIAEGRVTNIQDVIRELLPEDMWPEEMRRASQKLEDEGATTN